MQYPYFYDKVQTIPMQDALSDFLGAFEEGHVSFTYLDCVKYAGHSCPTVAGAYLMTLLGLQSLYPDTLPQRGKIHVSMKNPKEEGVTGVMCNIISFIVGASDQSGFKGIAGNFSRADLIHYN
ncbi:MAG: hypothetical protein U9N11_04215, partial [Campylobacterota bacterium]|nr:hypothetical protein [Campylobacterota bacterium]